jgi:phosphatidate cytidylyltransferase
MNKYIQRLLMFFIGLPLVVCLILFIPQYNHLALNIVVIILSGLGAVELAGIFRVKKLKINSVESGLLGAIGPVAMTFVATFEITGQVVSAAIIMGASWILISRIWYKKDHLDEAVNRAAAGFSVLIYPGLFMVWIIRMTMLSESSWVILVFAVTVMANDSIAWAAGMLFGKGNRGIILVSPNKSVAGFIGGTLASMFAALAGVFFLPSAFETKILLPVFSGIILGFVTAIAGSLGDLSESALKRSSGIKDSGTIIPGRGGVLDSIDSIALAAPVFYVFYKILFR